ncbi:hypothetical protein JCM16418A_01500 [Paenibacillus pini]
MNDQESVYCLFCEQIVPVFDTQYIFRTGFYRTFIPLGYCQNCCNDTKKGLKSHNMGHPDNSYATIGR